LTVEDHDASLIGHQGVWPFDDSMQRPHLGTTLKRQQVNKGSNGFAAVALATNLRYYPTIVRGAPVSGIQPKDPRTSPGSSA